MLKSFWFIKSIRGINPKRTSGNPKNYTTFGLGFQKFTDYLHLRPYISKFRIYFWNGKNDIARHRAVILTRKRIFVWSIQMLMIVIYLFLYVPYFCMKFDWTTTTKPLVDLLMHFCLWVIIFFYIQFLLREPKQFHHIQIQLNGLVTFVPF